MKNEKAAQYVSDLISNAINNGYYSYPEIKDILRHVIRRISDGLSNWHATNQYRSIEVKNITEKEGVKKDSQYHDFCNKTSDMSM
jgi:hypothetical protein